MRRKIIAIFMGLVYILMLATPTKPLPNHDKLFHYYLDYFIVDTGAMNAVTGIYLNYRVYDTLFETLLLLVSVIGIIHFSKHEDNY